MCRAVKCKVCGKTTWAGCGQHIAAVKHAAPAGQWCDGRHDSGPGRQPAPAKRGWFRRRSTSTASD